MTAERDGGNVLIRVIDNGIGLATADLPRIFEMFTQVSASRGDRPNAGLGIGLALARALVELHGGTIEAKRRSRQGHGIHRAAATRVVGAGRGDPGDLMIDLAPEDVVPRISRSFTANNPGLAAGKQYCGYDSGQCRTVVPAFERDESRRRMSRIRSEWRCAVLAGMFMLAAGVGRG